MAERRTQVERSQATRAALVAAARDLFTENGFAATGRDQIAAKAGVTRGALYHHFAGKDGLFRVVFEELEAEIVEKVVVAGGRVADPAESLRVGCMAFLDACLDPAVRRIVLIEAPVVLGWATWREVDARYGLALVIHGLDAAMTAGRMERVPVEPLAHMLLGALNEAAMLVATAQRPEVVRREVGETLGLLLDRLVVE